MGLKVLSVLAHVPHIPNKNTVSEVGSRCLTISPYFNSVSGLHAACLHFKFSSFLKKKDMRTQSWTRPLSSPPGVPSRHQCYSLPTTSTPSLFVYTTCIDCVNPLMWTKCSPFSIHSPQSRVILQLECRSVFRQERPSPTPRNTTTTWGSIHPNSLLYHLREVGGWVAVQSLGPEPPESATARHIVAERHRRCCTHASTGLVQPVQGQPPFLKQRSTIEWILHCTILIFFVYTCINMHKHTRTLEKAPSAASLHPS